MGLLDEILKQAGGASGAGVPQGSSLGAIAELVMKNPQIAAAALSMLNPKDGSVGGGSGLGELVSAFSKGGLADVMSSWVGNGPNKSIDPGALANVLGPDVLGQFARKAGIGAGDASSVLASVLPGLVNQLTPQGQVPHADTLESSLGSLLGQLGAR
jgi:uncharacterized protein YidB (DUF937 family)